MNTFVEIFIPILNRLVAETGATSISVVADDEQAAITLMPQKGYYHSLPKLCEKIGINAITLKELGTDECKVFSSSSKGMAKYSIRSNNVSSKVAQLNSNRAKPLLSFVIDTLKVKRGPWPLLMHLIKVPVFFYGYDLRTVFNDDGLSVSQPWKLENTKGKLYYASGIECALIVGNSIENLVMVEETHHPWVIVIEEGEMPADPADFIKRLGKFLREEVLGITRETSTSIDEFKSILKNTEFYRLASKGKYQFTSIVVLLGMGIEFELVFSIGGWEIEIKRVFTNPTGIKAHGLPSCSLLPRNMVMVSDFIASPFIKCHTPKIIGLDRRNIKNTEVNLLFVEEILVGQNKLDYLFLQDGSHYESKGKTHRVSSTMLFVSKLYRSGLSLINLLKRPPHSLQPILREIFAKDNELEYFEMLFEAHETIELLTIYLLKKLRQLNPRKLKSLDELIARKFPNCNP